MYLVFFYDTKFNEISKPIAEVYTRQEAESEVDKLREQDLPAFYLPKEKFEEVTKPA